jgi:hypothetical protein
MINGMSARKRKQLMNSGPVGVEFIAKGNGV